MKPAPQPSGAELATMGAALAAAFLLPLFAGMWADSRWHSSPIGVVVGVLLGIVAASLAVYQRFKRYW